MDIQTILDSELWDSIESNYNSGKYTNAIVDAMLFFTNTLREKSNLEEDGVKLVNLIFSKKDPKIRITKLETETEKSIQEGYAHILRGIYQLIRNPRHHDKIKDSENEAIQIILFINYMLNILEKSKAKFDLEDIESIILDEEFVDDDKYTTLITERIPKRKINDVLISIYRKKTEGDINHIQRFFTSIFKKLSENEIHAFMQIISKDLLKTKDDNERKYILRCFPANKWDQIDEISRLRTENRIINSIKDGKSFNNRSSKSGWFATWCTHLIKEFTLKEELLSLVGKKLSSKNGLQVRYIFKHIMSYIWSILDEENLKILEKTKDDFLLWNCDYLIVSNMKEQLDKGNDQVYEYINDYNFTIPDTVLSFFSESLKNFKENQDLSNDDDDLPF